MKLRYKVGLFIAGILGSTALLQRCNRPFTFKGPAEITYKGGGNTVVVKQKDKPPVIRYQPDPKSTTITTDDKGNVTVKIRQFGVGFEPGLGVGYSNKTRLALDARWVYWNRLGGHIGLGMSLDPDAYGTKMDPLDMVDPYVGISYVPVLRFSNTSVVLSYTVTQRAFVFLRFRL